jgi:flagellar M-ring protein FliF
VQAGADGKPVWAERGADDIARIRRLVQSAIGFDEKRGDKVEVVSMRFAVPDEGLPPPAGLLGLGIEKSDVLGMGQSAILAVVVLLALMFVLRPMVLRLSAISPDGMAAAGAALLAGPGGVSLSAPMRLAAGGPGAPPGAPAMLTDESMVNMANVEGQLRASSLRKLSEMVEKHPEESLAIMRGWLTQEPG